MKKEMAYKIVRVIILMVIVFFISFYFQEYDRSEESDKLNLNQYIEENKTYIPLGYNLIWNDGFDILNSSKWNLYDNKGLYSPFKTNVQNGNLVFESTNINGLIRSGAVTTKGKFNFKYGYIEIRAKFPTGNGYMSALWLRNDSQWPPEIDIIEHLGKDTYNIYMTRLCSAKDDAACEGKIWNKSFPYIKYKQGSYTDKDWSQDYHIYAVEWTPSIIRWIIDGVERYNITTGIPNISMYIFMNTCVSSEKNAGVKNWCGHGWAGPIDSTTLFPQYQFIDYVRVYQK